MNADVNLRVENIIQKCNDDKRQCERKKPIKRRICEENYTLYLRV